MKYEKSKELYEEAIKYMPGGVNSPVRAFKAVGMTPIFIESAYGSHVIDADDNEYIDYVCSWGPLILGHSPSQLVDEAKKVIDRGTSYGFSTSIEIKMAKAIVNSYRGIDKVRLVNSGTEATMSALRAARGYTGRNKIVKFEGCYHGHNDALLVSSGSGALTYGVSTSLGVPEHVVKDTLISKYNDCEEIEKVFQIHGSEIAAVIVETVAGNMGLIESKKIFLQTLRKLCSEYGAVLIFDEVITGFRIAYGSSPEYFGVEPDMVCLGKIIGGGLPVGAYGGKSDIMSVVSPDGPVYQAGTLSGNPLAMHMGYKNLEILKQHPEIYRKVEDKAKLLAEGFRKNIRELGLNFVVHQSASLVCLFFTKGLVENYNDVKRCNTNLFKNYYKEMLEKGIILPPSQFECLFLSYAHTSEDIERTINANYESLKKVCCD